MKEDLTLEHVKQDLLKIVELRGSNISDWRLSYIVPVTLLAVIVGFLLKNVWIGLLIFSVSAYHIVRLVIEARQNRETKKLLKNEIQRGDVAVSIETLDHITQEIIYEPYAGRRSHHVTKEVKFFYFLSGIRWRVPNVITHYPWSKNYSITSKMLDMTAVEGNEFYVISLQSNHEIAYVYNTKFFDFKDCKQKS